MRLRICWMIPTGIFQRSTRDLRTREDRGRYGGLAQLDADRCPVESGRFNRTVGHHPGAPERLVSRSGAAQIAFFGVVFAHCALKAAAGQKRSRKKWDSFPSQTGKKGGLKHLSVWRGPGHSRPRKGGRKPGRTREKERRVHEGGGNPQVPIQGMLKHPRWGSP